MGLHQAKISSAQLRKLSIKRLPTEWEKIFINYISDKGLMSKIHIEPMQLNIKKPKNTWFD